MDTQEFKQFVADTLGAQDEVATADWPWYGDLTVRMTDDMVFNVAVKQIAVRYDRQPDLKEPADPRALILWEIVNCWYPDVALALRECAFVMQRVNRPLNADELFTVAADLHLLERTDAITTRPMDATWAHTVEIAHDALLSLNGDTGSFLDSYASLEQSGHGPVGTYEETARLMIFATGPMPAQRHAEV